MPRFSRLGPGDRFRALVGAQVAQDPQRVGTALRQGIDNVGQPRGLERQQIKNEYESFRMLADDPERLRAYANQVLDRAARNSGLTVAELKSSVAQAMTDGLQNAEVVAPEAMAAAREIDGIDHELLAEALAELDALVGLEPLKDFVHKLVEDATWDALVGKNADAIEDPFGDEPEKVSKALRHLRFAGNPGAGKTTAVNVLGKVYKALGKLSEGHVHKVEAKDLIAKYLGQTVAKTTAEFEKARGGVFFIDDIQTLLPRNADGGGDQYSREALDTLLGFAMEMDVLIAIATYPDKMDEFLDVDPGFKSRFPSELEFPDYSPKQLTEIFERLCHANKIDYTAETIDKVGKLFDGLKLTRNFGNARLVENCFADWTQNQRTRVLGARDGDNPPVGFDVKTLLPDDITQPSGGDLVTIGGGGLRTRDDIRGALDGCVVGHQPAKAALADAVFERMHLRAAGKGTQKPVGFHFFAGPSGVGKTELAKGLADTAYNGNLEVIDCSKLTSLQAVEAMVHGRLAGLDGKSSVVLLDEVEKAHPALFTHLLRVADEGKLMKMNGDADLSSCHFIMTSNLGNPQGLFDEVDPKSQLGEYKDPAAVEAGFTKLFDKELPAEFKGRLSEDPIVFRPLGKGALNQILDGSLHKLVQVQAQAYDRKVVVTPKLRQRLVDLGHDPRLGARPMERVVRRQVLLPFLEALVEQGDKHPPGHVLTLDLGGDEKPKVSSAPDPELEAAAAARSKKEQEADLALNRAFAFETLTTLALDDDADTAQLGAALGQMHALLPKAVETYGITEGFASLMKEAADDPKAVWTAAVATAFVEAKERGMGSWWPFHLMNEVHRGVKDATSDGFFDEPGHGLSYSEGADIMQAAVEGCGKRITTAADQPAKLELANAVAAVGHLDDGKDIRDALMRATERADALNDLGIQMRGSDADPGVIDKALQKLAKYSEDDSPYGALSSAATHVYEDGDLQDHAYGMFLAAARAALAAPKAIDAAFATTRDLIRDGFLAEISDIDLGSREQVAMIRWALSALVDASAKDAAANDIHDALVQTMDEVYGSPAKQWGNAVGTVVGQLGLEPPLAPRLEAAAGFAKAHDSLYLRDLDSQTVDDTKAAATQLASAFGRTEPRAKLAKKLVKLADAAGEDGVSRAGWLLHIGGHALLSGRLEGDASGTDLGNKLRTATAHAIDDLERMFDTDEIVDLLRGVLDSAKAAYPSRAEDGAWARKAGAALARKSVDEQYDILVEAFRPAEG